MGTKAGFDDDKLFDIAEVEYDKLSSTPADPESTHKKVYFKSDEEFRQLDSTGSERYVGEKLCISSNDTTLDYLPSKLEAGSGITFTPMYDGSNEKLKVEVNNAVGSSRLCALCGYAGNAGAKYLEWFRNVPGDDSPLVIAEAGKIKSYSVSYKTSATCTFSIRKNGVEIDTLTVTSDNRGYTLDDVNEVVAGDEITVYVSSGSPQDVTFVISILIYI